MAPPAWPLHAPAGPRSSRIRPCYQIEDWFSATIRVAVRLCPVGRINHFLDLTSLADPQLESYRFLREERRSPSLRSGGGPNHAFCIKWACEIISFLIATDMRQHIFDDPDGFIDEIYSEMDDLPPDD